MTKRQGSGADRPAPDAAQRARVPRRPTPKSLENAAAFYLQRFPASTARLRRVLRRRVERAARVHDDIDRAEAEGWIETILERFRRVGWLDDARHAETKAGALFRRGESARAIRARLAAEGVDRAFVNEALDRLADESPGPDPDLAAAANLARRRRLGPYRDSAEARAAHRDRDLAALARKGFSAGVARRVLEAEDPETLAALVADAEPGGG